MRTTTFTWSGSLPSKERQDELLSYAAELAEHTLEALPGQDRVRVFDEWVEGSILLSIDSIIAVPAPDGAKRVVRPKGHEAFVLGQGEHRRYYFPMTRVHLRGMDIRIGDRSLCWPLEGRLTFVFASSSELPEPAGHLVLVDMNRNFYRVTGHKAPDCVLHQPRLTLGRLFLEPVHNLLGWMKCFFMQDMYLARRQTEPEYEATTFAAIPLLGEGNMKQAREDGFRSLLRAYDAHLQRQVRADQCVWPPKQLTS